MYLLGVGQAILNFGKLSSSPAMSDFVNLVANRTTQQHILFGQLDQKWLGYAILKLLW